MTQVAGAVAMAGSAGGSVGLAFAVLGAVGFSFKAILVKLAYRHGVDAETLQSAKRYVLGQFAPDYETAAQLASAIADLDLYGQPRDLIDGYGDRIEAASAADVAAARAVFASAENTLLVAIGDASKIRDAVAKFGPVTEMKIADPGFAPAAQ